MSLNLPPPAGGSPFHTKVQRSRRHQQLWRLRRGGDPRFSNRKVRQGVCGVLEGEKVDISGKWSGIFALFKKTWDGAKTVFFSNLRSPFIPRRPHMAEWGQHNPQVPITSHCLIHLGIKADTSLFSFWMHTFFFFFFYFGLFLTPVWHALTFRKSGGQLRSPLSFLWLFVCLPSHHQQCVTKSPHQRYFCGLYVSWKTSEHVRRLKHDQIGNKIGVTQEREAISFLCFALESHVLRLLPPPFALRSTIPPRHSTLLQKMTNLAFVEQRFTCLCDPFGS